MKKITKLLTVALTLALLFGVVLGVSAVADGNEPAAQADEKWIVSTNVVYAESIYPMFAVDASLAADPALLEVTVERDGAVSDCYNKGKNVEITTGAGTKTVHIYKGAGVPAKDMTDALTITVKYDGAVVETKTYSVVEYFFERLYKNEVVLGTDANSLLQKDLYVATLEYCTAAQGVLEPAAVVDLSQFIYVWGDAGNAFINKNTDTVALGNAVYNIEYFDVNGATGAFDVAAEAGEYKLPASAKIYAYELGDTWAGPEGALNFDSLAEAEIEGVAPNKTVVLDASSAAITKAQIALQSKTDGAAAIKNLGDSNYLRFEKTVGVSSSAQSWIDFFVDAEAGEAQDTAIVIEARMRLDFDFAADGIEINLYPGDRSNSAIFRGSNRIYISADGGKIGFKDSNMNRYATDDEGKLIVDGEGKNVLVKDEEGSTLAHASTFYKTHANEGEWFTFRLVYEADSTTTLYVLNESGEDIVIGEGDEAVSYASGSFVPYFTFKYSEAPAGYVKEPVALDSIVAFNFMSASKTVYTHDIDYVYFGNVNLDTFVTTTQGVANTSTPSATLSPVK